jgi:hypothetical protein
MTENNLGIKCETCKEITQTIEPITIKRSTDDKYISHWCMYYL